MPPGPVLHVTPFCGEAWAYGGIPRVVAAQVRELGARGLAVVVATTDACGERQRLTRPRAGGLLRPWRAVIDGAEHEVFPNLSNRLAHGLQLFMPVGLRRWLSQRASTFVAAHLHGCHNLPGALAARALSRAGVPYVVQPNGTAPRIERRRALKLVFDLTLGRAVLRCAARVIAVSEAERRSLLALGLADEKVVLIPNPVEATRALVPARGAFRAGCGLDSAPLVAYLGQLSPRKRVDLLVEAVASLADTTVRLVIAGPDRGSLGALRRQVAHLGLQSRTVLLEVLGGNERLGLLADADVVAYATEQEVFGLVPLEALLCGTPVVVGDDSGCGEIVSAIGGGLVVRTGCSSALAAALAEILANPEPWRDRALTAARQVRERFSPAVVASRLEALYTSLAEGCS